MISNNLSHINKTFLRGCINPSTSLKSGLNKNSVVPAIEQGLREGRARDYDYRQGTSLFYDYGLWFGVNDREVREPLTELNPSLRELIDFYNFPRITTLGRYPFQSLFLKCEWDKFGITPESLKTVKADVKESLGPLGWAMLIDTMNFIMTGERDIPIDILVSYMDSNVPCKGLLVEERFDSKELAQLSTTQFLTKWVSSEKGMNDCIEMHRLAFNIEC